MMNRNNVEQNIGLRPLFPWQIQRLTGGDDRLESGIGQDSYMLQLGGSRNIGLFPRFSGIQYVVIQFNQAQGMLLQAEKFFDNIPAENTEPTHV